MAKPIRVVLIFKEADIDKGVEQIVRVEIVKSLSVCEAYELNKLGWNLKTGDEWVRWLEAAEISGDGTLIRSTLML